jgi:hypothetical protein
MLFGGEANKTYLGCLNGPSSAIDSIFNEYGLHGGRYATESIWNPYGAFGSEYSSFSPWNRYASHPPIIVDSSGNFHGTFTVNESHPSRTTIPELVNLLDVASKRN